MFIPHVPYEKLWHKMKVLTIPSNSVITYYYSKTKNGIKILLKLACFQGNFCADFELHVVRIITGKLVYYVINFCPISPTDKTASIADKNEIKQLFVYKVNLYLVIFCVHSKTEQ